MQASCKRCRRTSVLKMLALSLALALGAGCAGKTANIGPVFWPPPPDAPHIQYLTGINTSRDVGEKKNQDAFSLIVTGTDQATRVRKLGKSYGIAAANNKLYLAEIGNMEVVVIDPVKGVFESPSGLLDPRGKLKVPVNVAVDKTGNLYVADTGRGEVVVYAPDGHFVKAIGKEFPPTSKIVAVATYEDNLYLLDAGTGEIRVLDIKSGEQVTTLGKIDKQGQSLVLPTNLSFDDKGFIYVTNTGNNRVMKYDRDGNYLGNVGGIGDRVGNFSRPKGIAVDKAGRIYVVDAAFSMVQVFDDKMHILTFFGEPGHEAGSLNLPAGIAVSNENLDIYQKFAAPGFKVETLIYVVNQLGQEFNIPRISVYGMGKMEGANYDPPPPPKAKDQTKPKAAQ